MAQERLLTIAAISLFTEDVAASKKFYTEAFQVPVINEDPESFCIKLNNVLINVLHSEAAEKDFVGLGNVAPPGTGKRSALSIWVDDIAAEMTKLESRGVKFVSGPEDKPWGLRVALFEDPSGHTWEIAQSISK